MSRTAYHVRRLIKFQFKGNEFAFSSIKFITSSKKSVTSVCILNYLQLDKAQRTQRYNGSHVEGDEQHGGKGKNAGWLRHRIHGVDECVHDACDGGQAEQIAGNQRIGICAEINQGHHEVRQNVLHVIAMRSVCGREKKEHDC